MSFAHELEWLRCQSVTQAQQLLADSGAVECVVYALKALERHSGVAVSPLYDRLLFEAVTLANSLLLGDADMVRKATDFDPSKLCCFQVIESLWSCWGCAGARLLREEVVRREWANSAVCAEARDSHK